MHHPVHKASKSSMLLLLIVLNLYSLSSCGTNPGSSTLHINDKVRATGTPVSGKPHTSFVPPGGHYESLAVGNRVTYFGSDNGNLYALQANNGNLLWHYDLPASFDNTLSLYGPPVIVSDVLYIAVNSGTVYALKAHDGTLLWSHTNGRSAFGPLIVTDGTVQVSTQGNNIYALRVSDGALLWQHSIGSFQTWEVQSPHVSLATVSYMSAPMMES